MKAIFTTSPDTEYDDDIAVQYHFPNRYINIAEKSIGDWVIYYQPSRGGGAKSYIAVARLKDIVRDREKPDHWYAYLDHYLPFDKPVPLFNGIRYYEKELNNVSKGNVGTKLQGRSIRSITDFEFSEIILQGMSVVLNPNNAIALEMEAVFEEDQDLLEVVNTPVEQQERRIEQILINKKIREASFRRTVMDAYDRKCAVTGLQFINGMGRAEAQAAHIKPVADGGPDTISNGISLSGTCHWLFDRHLISFSDKYELLLKDEKIPGEFKNLLLLKNKKIILPSNERQYPHLDYIQHHREIYEKGVSS